jgi:hypothetical protein
VLLVMSVTEEQHLWKITRSCEHSNEFSSFTRNDVRGYQLLKNYVA